MSRDHRRLRVFIAADEFVTGIYRLTEKMPADERYGLRAQLRRAATAVAANIVEGSARRSTKEYGHFIDIAGASASEAHYLLDLCARLGLVDQQPAQSLVGDAGRLVASLRALSNALRTME